MTLKLVHFAIFGCLALGACGIQNSLGSSAGSANSAGSGSGNSSRNSSIGSFGSWGGEPDTPTVVTEEEFIDPRAFVNVINRPMSYSSF